ncbi:MAG: T9SS type A sorting domain-containing protein, partial [Bacteroidales bacterium]
QRITAEDITRTYGDEDFVIPASSNTGNPLTYTLMPGATVIRLYMSNRVEILFGGNAVVKVSQKGDEYHFPAEKEVKITILRKAQTVSPIDDITKYVDEVPFTLRGKASSREPVIFESTNTKILRIDKNTAYLQGPAGSVIVYAIQKGTGNYLPDTFRFEVKAIDIQPNITLHPFSTEVLEGDSACFISMATGTNLRYQWYLNGTAIEGAINSSFCIWPTGKANNGIYYVHVSNSSDSLKSTNAQLTSYGVSELLNTIKPYPNPTSGICYVGSVLLELQEFIIYTINGTSLKSGKFKDGYPYFDISELPSGFYIVLIVTDKGSVAKRIMKKQ